MCPCVDGAGQPRRGRLSAGFFVKPNGTGVADYGLFDGAQRAVVINSDGKEFPIDCILGANSMYDVVKFRIKTDKEVETYMVEPYVIAADIYSNPDHKGRGGWTWYTGSSGWFYRVGLEYICGFTLRGKELEITPHMPTKWSEIKICYHYLDTVYQIVVSKEATKIIVDGKKQDKILLVNDGKTHQVEIGVDK